MDLAGAVRRDDDDGRLIGLIGAYLGNRDLEVRQHLEQVALELLVGAVELVDQEDRRARVPVKRLQERPLDEELFAKQLALCLFPVNAAGRLQEPDMEKLARVVPLVDRLAHVSPS